MAQDFGDDMGNALLNFVTSTTPTPISDTVAQRTVARGANLAEPSENACLIVKEA